MARQKIMMPVDENDDIDYRIIERHVKTKEIEKIYLLINNMKETNYEKSILN